MDDIISRMEQQWGINLDGPIASISQVLANDPDPYGAVAGLSDPAQVGRILLSSLPVLSKTPGAVEAVQQVSELISARSDAERRMLALMAATAIGKSNERPNSAVTLYARDKGLRCEPGNVYALRPRKNGVLESSDFEFESTMTFYRGRVEPIDCAEGFFFPGGSVGLKDEKARPFDNDVSIGSFRPEVPVLETPLASLSGRSPAQRTTFTAQICLDAPPAALNANDRIFHGFTIEYFDVECTRNMAKAWAGGAMDLEALMEAIQARVSDRAQRVGRSPRARSLLQGLLLPR